MTKRIFDVYLNVSLATWRTPDRTTVLTWGAVCIPASEKKRAETILHGVLRSIPYRSGVYKERSIFGSGAREKLGAALGAFSTHRGHLVLFATPDDQNLFDLRSHLPRVLLELDSALLRNDQIARVKSSWSYPDAGVHFRRIKSVEAHWPLDAGETVLAQYASWVELQQTKQKMISDFFRHRLTKFQRFLADFPLLGATDPFGKELINAIERAPRHHIQSEIWYRARRVTSSKVYTSADMGAPPPQLVTVEGRYNHIGKPILYLAEDSDTCGAELAESGETLLMWVQEFSIRNKTVLDLTVARDLENELKLDDKELLIAALLFEGAVNQPVQRNETWKPQFYVPRFIADAARATGGLDGIRYVSTRGAGFNLAVFTWEDVEPIGDPMLHSYLSRGDFGAGRA